MWHWRRKGTASQVRCLLYRVLAWRTYQQETAAMKMLKSRVSFILAKAQRHSVALSQSA